MRDSLQGVFLHFLVQIVRQLLIMFYDDESSWV